MMLRSALARVGANVPTSSDGDERLSVRPTESAICVRDTTQNDATEPRLLRYMDEPPTHRRRGVATPNDEALPELLSCV